MRHIFIMMQAKKLPEQEEGDIEMSPLGPKIMMAVEVEEEEELDMLAAMPQEHVVSAVARAITLTETDVGLAQAKVS